MIVRQMDQYVKIRDQHDLFRFKKRGWVVVYNGQIQHFVPDLSGARRLLVEDYKHDVTQIHDTSKLILVSPWNRKYDLLRRIFGQRRYQHRRNSRSAA